MTEYIDRKTALNVLWYNADEACSAVVGDFEAIPAADVKPIVRGKWIYGKEIAREYLAGECIAIDYEDILCSVCKTHYRPYVGNFNYCPNCGADMREGQG